VEALAKHGDALPVGGRNRRARVLTRLLLGALVAIVVAVLARRAHSLTPLGAVAATVVGTSSIAAGWDWGVLLIAFFVSSTALSRFREPTKAARTEGMLEKGGERDAAQVLANGGVFAAAALASLTAAADWRQCAALGAGALAASASDTWATEIGTLVGAEPRSIVTLRRVSPGTSGGVTAAGTLAALAGAAFVAVVAWALRWPLAVVGAVLAGGVLGSTIDSVLGATVQAQRWCDHCAKGTERRRHDCGTPTRLARGVGWLENDAVNLLSSAAGGLFAMSIVR